MATPRKLGELVAIPIKGRKLVNRAGGKQSPYVQLQLSDQKKRTKASLISTVEPEWDQEIHLDVFVGRLDMHVSVYDEGRKNELIGDGILLLNEVIDKGELDVWFPIKSNGSPAGDIYFELTFYAAAPPPVAGATPPPHNAQLPNHPPIRNTMPPYQQGIPAQGRPLPNTPFGGPGTPPNNMYQPPGPGGYNNNGPRPFQQGPPQGFPQQQPPPQFGGGPGFPPQQPPFGNNGPAGSPYGGPPGGFNNHNNNNGSPNFPNMNASPYGARPGPGPGPNPGFQNQMPQGYPPNNNMGGYSPMNNPANINNNTPPRFPGGGNLPSMPMPMPTGMPANNNFNNNMQGAPGGGYPPASGPGFNNNNNHNPYPVPGANTNNNNNNHGAPPAQVTPLMQYNYSLDSFP